MSRFDNFRSADVSAVTSTDYAVGSTDMREVRTGQLKVINNNS